jgi:hypothetical protein
MRESADGPRGGPVPPEKGLIEAATRIGLVVQPPERWGLLDEPAPTLAPQVDYHGQIRSFLELRRDQAAGSPPGRATRPGQCVDHHVGSLAAHFICVVNGPSRPLDVDRLSRLA